MSETTNLSRKGVPKGDKRARTRAALIEAAAQVIGERGYERTSLEAVASRAGMSRGAIYGNFASKEELLMAFVERHWRPSRPQLRAGVSLREQLAIIGGAVADTADQRRNQAAGMFSFLTYAMAHPRLREEMSARNVEVYAGMEAGLARLLDPEELPMPLGDFVRVLHAMGDGFTNARFLQPEVFTRELIVQAFVALA